MAAFEDLKGKLREIFQLDRTDLDFGLYRIMNLKSEEVSKFIEEDLLPQVKNGLKEYSNFDYAEIQSELEKTIEQSKELGLSDEQIENLPKIKDLKSKLVSVISTDKLENEIYSDLYNFFKRYYSEGDFMSLRRYKEGVYALPYEGEEVTLHWANADLPRRFQIILLKLEVRKFVLRLLTLQQSKITIRTIKIEDSVYIREQRKNLKILYRKGMVNLL